VLAGVISVVLASTGCGGATTGAPPATEQAADQRSSTPARPDPPAASSSASTPVMTIEQLAAALGCQATGTMKAADYRQARCTIDGADMVLLDFDTAEGQRAWVDYAVMYGGVYLVGNRWALSGKSEQYMESLRAKLVGTIEERKP
jgi:hypothetical protein